MARTIQARSAFQFPPAWLWLVDEAIPTYVKSKYSPRESWKDKPFTKEDAKFFFKGVEELSEIFTEERKKIPTYFNHPKFRSAYLLYFLPLQAAKFLSLFSLYPKAMEAALAESKKDGVFRILDLGAGPATASLAIMLWILGKAASDQIEIPSVEIELVDTNAGTMEDGKDLLESFANSFPRLRGKIIVRTHIAPWWKTRELLNKKYSLIVLGHVLNESPPPRTENAELIWSQLLQAAGGAGILAVEPASRVPSQSLSKLRDSLLEQEIIEPSAQAIWGPCLHSGSCPLADGRDWCHFSMPVDISGEWFKSISRALSSERTWVKFSYLWFASREFKAPLPNPKLRRVISDALSRGPGPSTVLICEADYPDKYPVPDSFSVHRGDLVTKTGTGAPRRAPKAEIEDEDESDY